MDVPLKVQGNRSFGHRVQVFRFDKAGKEVAEDLQLFVMQFMDKCRNSL